MASVKFLYRSSKDKAKLKLRLRHHVTYPDGTRKNFQPEINLDVEVYKADFKSGEYDKQTKRLLEDIEDYVLVSFKSKKTKYFEPTSEWLKQTYNSFGNKSDNEDSQLLLDWIDLFISDLKIKGRSANRAKAFNTYKTMIDDFDASIEMHELSINKLEEIYSFHRIDMKSAKSTVQRFMKDLILIGKFAKLRGAELGANFLLYKVPTDTKSQIAKEALKPIVLTEKEIDAIYNLELTQPYLINTRKWMILAIYTAQRGGDVMKSIRNENFKLIDNKLHIELTQDKVGHHIVIPALSRVKEIYDSGEMPHPISLTKFNKYVKKICELAGIAEMIEHKKDEVVLIGGKKKKRKVVDSRPKYEYITSHTFRRTFCTLYHGKMKNEEIMKISGHKKESEFLKYIGKTDVDYSEWADEL